MKTRKTMNSRTFTQGMWSMAAAVLMLVVMQACGSKSDKKSDDARSGFRKDTAVVQVASVQPHDFQESFRVTGTLMARQQADLKTQIEGRVESVKADIGDHVKKGQLLMKIRDVDYKLALEQAEANLSRAKAVFDNAKREKKRVENLFDAGSASEQQRDQTEAAYQQAVAGLKQAQAARDNAQQRLDYTRVTAPYSGYITRRDMKAGDFARVGNPVFQISDLSVLEAELDVPEEYAGRIPTGLSVPLSFQNGYKPVDGVVTAVNPSIDMQSRTFMVKITVHNDTTRIPTGMFCSADISLPVQKNKLSVPKEAVQQFEGRTIVWVISGGKAHEREITEGPRNGNFVMVQKGLSQGEKVAVTGTSILIDGYPVEEQRSGQTAMR